jgi:APA family basic amino acid/polyamine antiporter
MQRTPLARVIGRWGLIALAVNGIIGSGIFGLPATIAGVAGHASPWAVLLAGAAMTVIAACYAEAASQFTQSGGTYVYVRRALGRLAGIQVGWMMLLVRLTACAASANLLVAYLGGFWPQVMLPVSRFAIITLLLGTLAALNWRGATQGLSVSTASVIGKLAGLGLLLSVGVWYLLTHPAVTMVASPTIPGGWLTATLLLFFAYGGYEIALNASGETRDVRRDAPFTLFGGMLLVTLLYTGLQLIVIRVLPDPAHSSRPLADSAAVILGRPGAVLISMAALVSVYGFLSANMLAMPRYMLALGESGDFPAPLAAVHPRFRTPHVAIAAFALATWLAALLGTFDWNVTLSAVGRLFYFGAVCASVPILRRKDPHANAFRLPGGMFLPLLGVAICLVLLTRVDLDRFLIVAVTIGVAFLNWLIVRRS